jgi:glycosyltransferase involved in cell wall biosynthesis/spore maturation protein CgeB
MPLKKPPSRLLELLRTLRENGVSLTSADEPESRELLNLLDEAIEELGSPTEPGATDSRAHSQILLLENENARLRAKLERQLAYRSRMADLQARSRQQSVVLHDELAFARGELDALRGSFAYRLGRTLASARTFRGMLLLPARLASLAWEGMCRLLHSKHVSLRADDRNHFPDFGPAIQKSGPVAPHAEQVGNLAEQHSRLTVGPALADGWPADVPQLRIACILDEFSFNAFGPCARFRQLSAERWEEEMKDFRPHLLFVESAWKGANESWARKVYPLSTELQALVAWCRDQRIPTVFWNKEDPVHTSIFMRTAREFDAVFTTDVDCVRSYKEALGHDQVYWLPFACQPEEHNPIEEYPRKDAFCFAGSFYAKYPERQNDFDMLISTLGELRPCEIYDRNFGTSDAGLAYPERFQHLVVGGLPYDQISIAYKGYRYGINLNTVKQSQSMFARRAFELLASNTVTVSNFSRGLRLLLGDLVVSSDDASQIRARLAGIVNDETAYRKFRLAGLREVMERHTYNDRLRHVVSVLRGSPLPDDLPEILVVARARDRASWDAIVRSFDRQEYPHRRLVLVVPRGVEWMPGAEPQRAIRYVTDDVASVFDIGKECSADWIAGFESKHYYGPNYLTDLALATRYTRASVIGKKARHQIIDGELQLVSGDEAYSMISEGLPLFRGIARVESAGSASLGWLVDQGIRQNLTNAFAVDEFNYCENGQGSPHAARVDDIEIQRRGIALSRMHDLAAGAKAGAGEAGDAAWKPDIDSREIASLIGAGAHAEGLVTLTLEDGNLQLASTLPQDKHVYLYSSSVIEADRLFPGGLGRFHFMAATEMLLSFVFIYLDEQRKRIGHAIRAVGSNVSLVPPPGTRCVRLGLRLQGKGTATIKGLVLDHLPSQIVGIPGRSRYLLVTRGYPSYDSLYSYAYVHRRVLGYKEDGLEVDVFRLVDGKLKFDEFEGVDVTSGSVADLECALASNRYECLLVHSLDRTLWSVIKDQGHGSRVVVWVHGAEVQPWYRRHFNLTDDRELQRAVHRSRDRMDFWKDFLRDIPDNVHLVFVSERLVQEVRRDLGVDIPRNRFDVIHNHVDSGLFRYVPKRSDQRTKILSIRPFSRRTYANDLTVKAILDLSREPYFEQLEFRIVGDGHLFDETVEPLRKLPNVQLEKRFLTQREIAELHREYGVFMCPSRIDSQGVSRDEAMASGLVAVTSRVSAVPEFVDPSCGFLAEPESWRGLADAIRALYHQPDLFVRLSKAAAERVRTQSGRDKTLGREVALMSLPGRRAAVPVDREPMPGMRIALYADLDMNLIDGSSIWAASLAEVLALDQSLQVDFYFKRQIRNTKVIEGLLDHLNVRLIEPESPDALSPDGALSAIESNDQVPYDAVVIRGFSLAVAAAKRDKLEGRLWTYLTDIPQDADALDGSHRSALAHIASQSKYLLCQTPGFIDHLTGACQEATDKARLLPPMIPISRGGSRAANADRSGPLRIAYAGKFAPLWGIREMFEVLRILRGKGLQIELHAFGEKIHNPPDDPGFKPEVTRHLTSDPGVFWHQGVTRERVMEALGEMDIGWAWRSVELESSTLELSTKILEYGACGLPPLLYPSFPNRRLLGDGYPLFADGVDEVVETIMEISSNAQIIMQARTIAEAVSGDYSFEAVARQHVQPLLGELR